MYLLSATFSFSFISEASSHSSPSLCFAGGSTCHKVFSVHFGYVANLFPFAPPCSSLWLFFLLHPSFTASAWKENWSGMKFLPNKAKDMFCFKKCIASLLEQLLLRGIVQVANHLLLLLPKHQPWTLQKDWRRASTLPTTRGGCETPRWEGGSRCTPFLGVPLETYIQIRGLRWKLYHWKLFMDFFGSMPFNFRPKF